MNQEKRGYEGLHTWEMKIKQMGLTRHSTAMDLMIQAPGDRMVPRQRFGPIPRLFMGASPERGAQTVVSHREVPQGLQQIKQHGDRHGVQHNRP